MFERSMMRLIPGIFRYERMGGEMGKNYREWRCLLATTLCLGILGFGPVSADNHEFSIAILPDIQTYTVKRPQILKAQVDWISANRVTENIIYVGQLGDLKNGVCNNGTIAWPSLGSPSTEWDIVRDAFDVLDLAVIPYGVTPGNHDFDQSNGVFPADSGGCPNYDGQRPLVGYNDEFPPSSFPVTNYGSRDPLSNEDNFIIVSSNGLNFLFINVGYQQETPAVGSTTVIDWAETLMTTYPNHITIVTSHFLIDCNASTTGGSTGPNGSCTGTPDYLVSTYGTNIFDRLRAYPNLFMMIGGHRFGESYFEFDRSAEGFNPVHVVLANYQHLQYSGTNFDTVPILGGANGLSGYFKLMRFDMDSMIVDLVSLSPALAAQSSIAGSPPILPVLSNVARPTTVISTRDIDPTVPANLFSGSDPTLHTQSVSNLVNISFAGYGAVSPTFDILDCEDMAGALCVNSLGSMELPSSSGTQTDGTGITLNYRCLSPGFCGFGGTIYDEGTIQSVNWAVDAGTGELTTFNMVLNNSPGCLDGTGPLPRNQTEAELSLISPGLMSVTMTDGGCELVSGSLSCNSNVTVNNPNLFVP